MKNIRAGLIAVGALVATLGAADLAAQANAGDGRRAMRGARGVGSGVELIMSQRERLELTEDQISRLDAIRRATVSQRAAAQAEMAEMRSRLQAGQIRQSEMMAFLEERRDAAPAARTDVQEQIAGILTDAQLETVDQMQSQRRAFVRGQASVRSRAGRSLRGQNRVGVQRGTPFNRGFRGRR